MKCDELKPLVFSLNELSFIDEPAVQKNLENPHDHAVYKATEVDAAIDELKDAHHKERHEYIEMVAQLKAKLEDVQASAYAEIVDAGMENRRLKRALWLARAEIAHKKIDEYWPDYCHNAHSRIALLKWEEVERKCRAKAEEYK